MNNNDNFKNIYTQEKKLKKLGYEKCIGFFGQDYFKKYLNCGAIHISKNKKEETYIKFFVNDDYGGYEEDYTVCMKNLEDIEDLIDMLNYKKNMITEAITEFEILKKQLEMEEE